MLPDMEFEMDRILTTIRVGSLGLAGLDNSLGRVFYLFF